MVGYLYWLSIFFLFYSKQKRAEYDVIRGCPPRPYPPPLEISGYIFFSSFKKIFFFLSRPLPPSTLVVGPLKMNFIFFRLHLLSNHGLLLPLHWIKQHWALFLPSVFYYGSRCFYNNNVFRDK